MNGQTERRASPGALLAWLKAHVGWKGDGCLTFPFGCNSAGYGQIRVGGRKGYAHRWMCEAIHGPAPTPEHEAAHSCGKGHEACVHPDHLRWATGQENMADRVQHGTANRGERQGLSKLTEAQAREVIRLHRQGVAIGLIAAQFGICKSNVSIIANGKSWAWLQEAA
ncbi:HNH endonuclease [Mesorhizobium sp. M0514]|uniref:HNH endonuclease n=1 Tax=Mesorhizobium sp. M0514 TaxID=2956955 RepID=UPI0033363603